MEWRKTCENCGLREKMVCFYSDESDLLTRIITNYNCEPCGNWLPTPMGTKGSTISAS